MSYISWSILLLININCILILTINVITKEEVQRYTFRRSRAIKQFKHRWTGKIFVGRIFTQTITNELRVFYVDSFYV